jgi:hypothetical protein
MSTIIWKYINQNVVAIEAIRDYNNMKAIINESPEEIKEKYNKLFSPSSAKYSFLPKQRNLNSTEINTINLLDTVDVIQKRYRQALEYMQWFEPAWSSLSENEKHILSEFYMSENRKSGATCRLMHELNYSERKIELMRSNALRHLRSLLFG